MRRLKKSGVPMPAQQVPWGTCPCSGPTYYHTFARFPLLAIRTRCQVVIGHRSPCCSASVSRRAADSTGPGSLRHRPDSSRRDHHGTAIPWSQPEYPDNQRYPPCCRSSAPQRIILHLSQPALIAHIPFMYTHLSWYIYDVK